jgi:hypothetical protein
VGALSTQAKASETAAEKRSTDLKTQFTQVIAETKAAESAAEKRSAELQAQISKEIADANAQIKEGLAKALDQQKASSTRLDQIAELSSNHGKMLGATQSQVGDTHTAVSTLADQVKSSDANAEKRSGELQTQLEQVVAKANAQTKDGLLKAIEQQKTAATTRLDQLNDVASSLASLAKLQNSTQGQVAETQAALATLVNQLKTSQAATDKRITDVEAKIAQAITDSSSKTREWVLKAIEQQKSPQASPTSPQP